jgi:hypothetical protein
VDLTGDPLGPRGLALAPLGGLAMVRPGWCALFVCGNTGEGRLVNVCRARNELSGQIGGSTNAPRPSRGRRAEGMGDDGTRDTASTRARTNASAGRLFAGGLRDATHVTRFVNARVLFLRTHLASAFVYRNNTNAVNTDSRRCAETRARACGAGSARVERVCACAIDALAGVGVRCGRAV